MSSHHDQAGQLEPKPATEASPERNGHQPAEPGRNGHSTPTPRRRSPWWVGLVLPTLVGAACGGGAYVVSTHYMRPWYSSATTLWFPSSGGGGVGNVLSSLVGGSPATDGAGNVGVLGNLYTAPQFGGGPSTAMAAMATGRVQGEVMTKLNLPAHWHLSPKDASIRLNKNINYGLDRNGFLSIQATDTDPFFAAKMVNAYVAAMKDVSTEMNVDYTRKVRRQLERTYRNQRAQLERQTATLVALQTGTIQRLPLGPGAASAYQDLAARKITMQMELNATNTEIKRRIATARKTYGAGTNLPTSVAFAQETLSRLRKAESEYHVAAETYGPDNPKLQEAQVELNEARAQAQAEAQRQMTAVGQGLTSTMSELYVKQATDQVGLADIGRNMASIKATAMSMPAIKAREEQLTADVKNGRVLLDTLQAALKQAQWAEERRAVPTFTVIDAAGPSPDPVAPRPLFTTVFATIAGFLLTAAFLLARSIMRQPVLVDGMRRWSERYIVMDPLDMDDEPRVLGEDARRPLAGETRRALEGGGASPMPEAERSRAVETEREPRT